VVKLGTTQIRTADEPIGNERPVQQWACDADAWTTRRTHIRAHLIIDKHGRTHLAKSVLTRNPP
jgi:hypothetical protein